MTTRLSIAIRRLPNGKQVGVFKLAGITWQTAPADTGADIEQSARTIADEYDRMLREKESTNEHRR